MLERPERRRELAYFGCPQALGVFFSRRYDRKVLVVSPKRLVGRRLCTTELLDRKGDIWYW